MLGVFALGLYLSTLQQEAADDFQNSSDSLFFVAEKLPLSDCITGNLKKLISLYAIFFTKVIQLLRVQIGRSIIIEAVF